LFGLVQRFTAFRGYWNRSDRTFVRPKDNCVELQEALDQDGDGLSAACKTDGEHTIGYRFHSLWGLWKSHHTVNQWMHQYIKEEYAKKQEDRAFPSFCKSLPKTLSDILYDLHLRVDLQTSIDAVEKPFTLESTAAHPVARSSAPRQNQRWTEEEDALLNNAAAIIEGGPPYNWIKISRSTFWAVALTISAWGAGKRYDSLTVYGVFSLASTPSP
jgi:hypothetical protein